MKTFIPYHEALDIILESTFSLPDEKMEVTQCIGRTMAENILADRDFPPFDRVTMDGIAIKYEHFDRGQKEFVIEKTVAAGTPRYTLEEDRKCVEIMTGAIMPEGVDTVIPYEEIEITAGIATIKTNEIKNKQNVHFQGLDKKSGDVLVPKGKVLTPADIAIAASVGKGILSVKKGLTAAILSTGDELVEINETPAPHQIRKSNVFAIKALLEQFPVEATLHHLPDDEMIIRNDLKKILENYDLVFLTGGVSKGKFDYIPNALEELGVQKYFHKIRQRPGKPFWFGKSSKGKPVIALPGNPVSAIMCATVYALPFLTKTFEQPGMTMKVKLSEDVKFPPDLTYFLQAQLSVSESAELLAKPILHHGSGDFANLSDSDGFIALPEGKDLFKKGEIYDFIPFKR